MIGRRPRRARVLPWTLRLWRVRPWSAICLTLVFCAASVQAQALRQMVIPFESLTREPRAYWLSEASAVILTDDLIALGMPAITRDDRLRAFERLHVPSVPTLSHATEIRLGQIVGASQVVVGSIELHGEILTVRARTILIEQGRISAEMAEVGALADVFGIFARLARRIVPSTSISIEQMEQGHPPIAAFEQYIKGLIAESPAARIQFLTQALTLAPTFQRPRLALWDAYTEQSRHREALAIAREVPADSRLAREARFRAALSLIGLAQHQEAFDLLSELNRASADPALLNDLGVVQLRRGAGASGGRAVSYFNEAATLDPSDSDLFFNLGYASWLDRDGASAIAWLREAVRRNPADDQAHYVLGTALQAAGNVTEANREKELARRLSSVYAGWEAKQPNGVTIPRGLERVKTDLDVPASLRLDNVVAAGQRDQQDAARARLEAGRRLFQAERDAEAMAELRRAVYLAPYQSEAHLLLGRLYLRGGRAQEAIDELKISIWSEDTIPAHVALAEAYLAAKDTTTARTELQAILSRDPENTAARRLLSELP